jgi:hypothetical protein
MKGKASLNSRLLTIITTIITIITIITEFTHLTDLTEAITTPILPPVFQQPAKIRLMRH